MICQKTSDNPIMHQGWTPQNSLMFFFFFFFFFFFQPVFRIENK